MLFAFLLASSGPREPLCPNWTQSFPCCPSLPQGQGALRTPEERGRLAPVKVKEAVELMTMTGSAFQSSNEKRDHKPRV